MPTADEMKLHYEAQSPADESPQQEWKYLHPHREAGWRKPLSKDVSF